MKRQSTLAKITSFALAASFLLGGCSIGTQVAPAAPASYAESAAMEAPAAAYYPDEPADMFFEDYGVRGFVTTAKDNLSTFAVDVDTGSYTVARSLCAGGLLPPEDACAPRSSSTTSTTSYPNPEAGAETFGITLDGAPFAFAWTVPTTAWCASASRATPCPPTNARMWR
jgi:hypothetical protein